MNLAYLLRMFMIHCLTGSMFDILLGLVLFWQLASFLAVLWALNVLAFLYSKFIHIPPYACPLALVIFLILYLINPFPILHYSSRMWLLKILVSGSISQAARYYKCNHSKETLLYHATYGRFLIVREYSNSVIKSFCIKSREHKIRNTLFLACFIKITHDVKSKARF